MSRRTHRTALALSVIPRRTAREARVATAEIAAAALRALPVARTRLAVRLSVSISIPVSISVSLATTAAAGYEAVQLRDERVSGVDDGQHLELMDTPIWTHAHPKHRTKRRC